MINEATIVGSVFGTIAYMSPEQANGQIVLIDKWSDVFSLGAVLCRLLTGLPPYQDPDKSLDQEAILARAQRGELQPAFDRLSRVKPRKLAALAQRCMAVHPSERPADAGELVRGLEQIKHAEQRTKRVQRFLAIAGSLLLITLGSFFWAKRDVVKSGNSVTFVDSVQPVESSYSVVELVREKVSLDSETARALLKSARKDVVLDNYRTVLDQNPKDEALYFEVEMALMNAARWHEGEEVARDLIKLAPTNADYHFLLSESFFWRGRYEEAKKVMLESKALRDAGGNFQFSVDESLSRLDKYTEILRQVDSLSPESLAAHSPEELTEIANACGQAGKFAIAIRYYKEAIDKETDVYRQTLLRSNFLYRYVKARLQMRDLSDEERERLSALCLEWLQEQVDSLPRLNDPLPSQLVTWLKTPIFDFARALANDERVNPEVRSKLGTLWASLQQEKPDSVDKSVE